MPSTGPEPLDSTSTWVSTPVDAFLENAVTELLSVPATYTDVPSGDTAASMAPLMPLTPPTPLTATDAQVSEPLAASAGAAMTAPPTARPRETARTVNERVLVRTPRRYGRDALCDMDQEGDLSGSMCLPIQRLTWRAW